jgi:hypothetical protein
MNGEVVLDGRLGRWARRAHVIKPVKAMSFGDGMRWKEGKKRPARWK